ncbi:MAG: 3-hydroxyacyl-CoA dehydrogenase family protein [Candidatus Jordarchaeaceae archaeon]
MKIEDVKNICVLGCGIMGSGIVQLCAGLGYNTTFYEISDEIVKRSMERIRGSLSRAVEKGKMTKEQMEATMAKIKGTTSLKEAAANADIVIEAIPENLELKKKTWKQLDEICPKHTIFASNTSSLMITDQASATKRPDKFIGMHFFNPAHVMKLVEIIRGAVTSDETYKVIYDLSIKMGKVPLEAKDGPGFFTTRFICYTVAEIIRLLELGIAGVKEIDTMVRLGFGWPMGPFVLADFVGLDTIYHVLEYCYNETGNPAYKPPMLLRKMVIAGYLGDPRQKPGSRGGFYEYFNIPREQ